MNADLSIYLYFVLFLILMGLFVASKIDKRKRASSDAEKGLISEADPTGSAEEEEAGHP